MCVANEALSPLGLDALAEELGVGDPSVGLALRHEEHLTRRKARNENKWAGAGAGAGIMFNET